MGVTKTDYMRGMQCPKMLWLDSHKPQEKIIPPEILEKLDAGNEFGDKAMAMFGEYVEMTTYKPSGRLDYTAMIQKTQEHLQLGTTVLCEAAFSYYNNYCAVDILRKTDKGYELYEVKNSDGVKEQFVKDIGFQLWILKKCGVKVVSCHVVYHGKDEENPFVIEPVTKKAVEYANEVNDNIWRLGKIKKQPDELQMQMGEQCSCPYECWYLNYCKNL